MSTKAAPKILVIAPAWVGDMVMAQCLFKLLSANCPGITIDVLAPSWTLPLLERMPEVRQAILSPFGHGQFNLISRYLLGRQLRKQKYDQAIVLPNSFKSALIVFWAKITLRTGWRGEWRIGVLNDVRKLHKKRLPLLIQRFLALGLPKNNNLPQNLDPFFPKLLPDRAKQQLLLQRFNLILDKPILAICPGAEYGPAKRWPAINFARVAKEMLDRGWQVWIFGSSKETLLAEEMVQETQNQCINLTGKTSLVEALDLLAVTQGAICNDSGLMHMAAALSLPLVVIYGSSSPDFTPPLASRVKKISLNLECSPCFKRSCPLIHFNCMNQITPGLVTEKLIELLS